MNKEYIIATGFFKDIDFYGLWYFNTYKYSQPKNIYITNCSGQDVNPTGINVKVENLGHIDNMNPSLQVGGWAMSFLLGCMFAYHNNCDMIYKESDCLAFGNWVDRLYSECSNHEMIIGKRNTSPGLESFNGQSLCLVKHSFTLQFVNLYLSIQSSDKVFLPEYKFEKIMNDTKKITTTTMGYDRSRPVNYSDDAFYMQQVKTHEIDQLKQLGLL